MVTPARQWMRARERQKTGVLTFARIPGRAEPSAVGEGGGGSVRVAVKTGGRGRKSAILPETKIRPVREGLEL